MKNILYLILSVILISLLILGAILGGYKLFLFMLLLVYLSLALPNLIAIKKPSDREWESLDKLFHFTSPKNLEYIKIDNKRIHLKVSRNPLVNAFVFGKPSVYFFYKEPSKFTKAINLPVTEASVKFTIDLKNIDRKYVRLRRYDSALLYLKDYKGPGKIN